MRIAGKSIVDTIGEQRLTVTKASRLMAKNA
jgi:hypothetical protein